MRRASLGLSHAGAMTSNHSKLEACSRSRGMTVATRHQLDRSKETDSKRLTGVGFHTTFILPCAQTAVDGKAR